MKKFLFILGLVLIVVGVSIIGYGLLRAKEIFSGKVPLPEFYAVEKTTSGQSKELGITLPKTEKIKIDLPLNIEAKTGTTGNVMIQYFFVLLVIMGGGRIAGVGVSLLKNPRSDEK